MTAADPLSPRGWDDRRLRIVVVRYGTEIIGGAETHARELATRLAARGWRVSVLTTRATNARTWRGRLRPWRTVEDGVEVHRLPVLAPRPARAFALVTPLLWRSPEAVRDGPAADAWLRLQGPWAPAVTRALAAEPDTPTLFITAIYLPTVAGIPLVRGARLLLPTAHDEPALRLAPVGRAIEAVDGVFYATPEERALLERMHPAIRGADARVGNAGLEPPAQVDADRFRRTRRVHGPYVLYGGRDTPGKGLDVLIQAMHGVRAHTPEAQVVLTGDAGRRAPRDQRDDTAAGVVRVGRLDPDEMWDAIAGASAVAVPSTHESLSLLALEAWAVGRPVVASGRSAALAGQVERTGGGLLADGAADTAAALARLLRDPAHGDRLGAAGKVHVSAGYRWDPVLDRLEELVASARQRARARQTPGLE